jgi:GT2 family glycosyltransferase
MQTGLVIVTCMPAGAPPGVRQRLPAALASLASSGYAGPVTIVDDGSSDEAHLAFLSSLSHAMVVVRRPIRGGIARAKNTALRVLRENAADVGFLAEDDIEFRPGWCEAYATAHQATGIQHFSWAWDDDPSGEMRKELRSINGYSVVATNRVNGVFLTLTPRVLEVVGGFKILPAFWGHEHTNWTRRIIDAGLAPFFADLEHSERYIGINAHADSSAIPREDRDRFDRDNAPEAESLRPLFHPFEE